MAGFKFSGMVVSIVGVVLVVLIPRTRVRSSVFLADDFFGIDSLGSEGRGMIDSLGNEGRGFLGEGSFCRFGDERRDRLLRFLGRSSSLSELWMLVLMSVSVWWYVLSCALRGASMVTSGDG
jgi:hypothetical protein